MIVLDTDHFNILQIGKGDQFDRLTLRMSESLDRHFSTTVITYEELMRGWLAAIHRERDVAKQVKSYDHLIRQSHFFAAWNMLRFSDEAVFRFRSLRAQRIRIGTHDLKIAAITLEWEAILFSANGRDFDQVPGLRVENWIL